MEITESNELLGDLEGNTFVGELPTLKNSKIVFAGQGNILFCEPGVVIQSSLIRFRGNNSLIMLGKTKHPCKVDFTIYNNNTLAVGRDNYFNGKLHIIVSEERMVFIGDGCLFSFGIWMRTADPHLVYDASTRERMNPSKDIVVGDHVWIGQDAMILKGSSLGSGCIVGAKAVVAGKRVNSNSSWAGNPAKLIRDGLFWDGASVHAWEKDKTLASQVYSGKPELFKPDKSTITAKELGDTIYNLGSPEKRLAYLQEFGYGKGNRNRLAIGEHDAKPHVGQAEGAEMQAKAPKRLPKLFGRA